MVRSRSQDGLARRLEAIGRRKAEAEESCRAEVEAGLVQLDARWTAADGLGPLPGAWAAARALRRGDMAVARRSVSIATQAVQKREDVVALEALERMRGPVVVPERPVAAEALLDDLATVGRPVAALTDHERTSLEQVADDPAAFAAVLRSIRSRVRADVLRYRLLFDVDRLADVLPAGKAQELSRQAEGCGGDGPEGGEDELLRVRERLLDALEGG